jgi:hypothetical protein
MIQTARDAREDLPALLEQRDVVHGYGVDTLALAYYVHPSPVLSNA